MSNKKSSVIKNVLSIFIITLVAVLLLAVVNQVTRDPIAQAEIDARNEVYRAVFAEAKDFEEIMTAEEIASAGEKAISEAGVPSCEINHVMAAVDGGNKLGYVIASTSKSGYGGDIQVAVGITADGKITGFSVIKHSETAGLGSKSAEPEFADQFAGKAAETIEFVKGGGATGQQIDAISGATITTTAVTNATNAAIAFYNSCLKGE
ncbi:MAG: RnfABCDGE type electron transport complex subunit G [Eubacterium sp.]|nr:RnfABCDGE type electron transport complex subunit G [Eubacterium sp.]